MKKRKEYERYWKDNCSFRAVMITPASFFIRMAKNGGFRNRCFESFLEALIFLRYRGLPEMIAESLGQLRIDHEEVRVTLDGAGCYLKSAGLNLLDHLDRLIGKETADRNDLTRLKELYNWASHFAQDGTRCDPGRIDALGHLEEFLRSECFREDFSRARLAGLHIFAELGMLFDRGLFRAELRRHRDLAFEFIEWTDGAGESGEKAGY